MIFQTEIRGMRFFHGDDGKAPFKKLALAEIYIPELSANVSEVVLTWSRAKGWVAQAPYSKRGGLPLIQWNYHGAFATDLAGKLKAMYLAMGGKSPEKPTSQFVSLHELSIPDDDRPMHERIVEALEAEAERRGVPCFTERWERAEPEADDDEAIDGLHRTLGVDAVAETMEQAGL